MHTSRFVFAAVFALALNGSFAAESWSLKASSKPVKVTGKVLDPLNVSGAASVKDGEFIIACDELRKGVQAGHLDLDKAEIHFDPVEVPLRDDGKKELDLESVAVDREHLRYFTCGSCSVKRKSGEPAPDRQWLFQIKAEAKTGKLLPEKVTKVSLKDAMKADAFLAEHMDKSAADLGIDIEGMAFKDGRLWFGLRSPNVNGWGFVVAASADDLMAKKPVVFQRFELPLGEDLGIRDIAAIKDGFLIITGPTGAHEGDNTDSSPKPEEETVEKAVPAETIAKAVPAKETVAKAAPAAKAAGPAKEAFALYYWAGDTSKPLHIGGLASKGKPEGLLVVSESAEKLGVMVFSDDAENGAPVLYDVSRPVRHEGPVPRNDK